MTLHDSCSHPNLFILKRSLDDCIDSTRLEPVMLLPPLTVPLLNATSLLWANSSSNAPFRNPVYCYEQRPAGQLQRIPALTVDCFSIAMWMVKKTPRADLPIKWSHDSRKGSQVPKKWSWKTCVVEINLPPGKGGAWEASYADIAFTINEIDAPCVHDGLHLGGLSKIGDESTLDIFVYGREWDPSDPPNIGIGTATS